MRYQSPRFCAASSDDSCLQQRRRLWPKVWVQTCVPGWELAAAAAPAAAVVRLGARPLCAQHGRPRAPTERLIRLSGCPPRHQTHGPAGFGAQNLSTPRCGSPAV